jgi:hypothetical protein
MVVILIKKSKMHQNDHMKNLNVMGANMNYDVSAFFGRNSKYSYLIGFKDQRIFNSSFTPKIFIS